MYPSKNHHTLILSHSTDIYYCTLYSNKNDFIVEFLDCLRELLCENQLLSETGPQKKMKGIVLKTTVKLCEIGDAFGWKMACLEIKLLCKQSNHGLYIIKHDRISLHSSVWLFIQL